MTRVDKGQIRDQQRFLAKHNPKHGWQPSQPFGQHALTVGEAWRLASAVWPGNFLRIR